MTPDEQLAYERQFAEILNVRNPKKDKPSSLETWLSSSVVVALVGVIGTGFFGAWITGLVQERSKNNELQRAAQDRKVDEQNKAVLAVLAVIANNSSAVDDLLTTVNSGYAEKKFNNAAERKDLVEWKKSIRKAHDDADSAWRRGKITVGYTLLYVFDNDTTVSSAWVGLAKANDAFETCADLWYASFADDGSEDRPEQVCEAERKSLTDALSGFTAAVANARIKPPPQS